MLQPAGAADANMYPQRKDRSPSTLATDTFQVELWFGQEVSKLYT